MIAAIPEKVNKIAEGFKTVPPGHRFSLYFPIWNERWELEKNQKGKALGQSLSVPADSVKQINALRNRQRTLIELAHADSHLAIDAIATSPLATGMGMEHPLENGFAFLNPYGLPYLPGSSIKGVLRRAAKELSQNNQADWNAELINTLFGKEDSNDASRGALTFWDAIPEIKEMGMDVMTPHYSDYYQGKSTPHDSGQPNPVVFMVIPASSKFTFHVIADVQRVNNIPEWKTLIQSTFDNAFNWLGFGAKTAVGYGAMRRLTPEEVNQARAEAQATSLHCPWVDDTIDKLVKENNSQPNEILRGKQLAAAWSAIEDSNLKTQALADIRARWEKEGWWENPPGKAAKTAKVTYTES